MPTRGREAMARAALDCWIKQDYANKELVVADDRDCPSFPGGLMVEQVNYSAIDRNGMTLGAKRNLICSMAAGKVIAHWDSDDWSAPDRISDQVRRLQETRAAVTGYSVMYFWDTMTEQAKLYKAISKGYVLGTSLCFTKLFWQTHHFPNQQIASDNGFMNRILTQIAASDDPSHMVARIHGDHTSKKDGITKVVARELIPIAFWENERARLS